jgi:amidophosphoribosyltransferase
LADACGVMGIYGRDPCAQTLHWGLHALQHRGQRFGGMAVANEKDMSLLVRSGLVDEWPPQEVRALEGNIGIGHVSRREAQPVKHRSRFGQMAVCFSGKLTNASEVLAAMLAEGRSFAEGSQTEVLSKVIGSRRDVAEGLTEVFSVFEGAFSLLVVAGDALYAARDPYGRRPLVLGWAQGQWAVASESRALHGLDFLVKRDLAPGEILRIDAEGITPCHQAPSPRRAHCAFEWAYIASQDSMLEGIWVRDARKRMGRALADRDAAEDLDADVVAPVPRSGIGSALGYQAESGLPYEEVFLDLRSARWQDSDSDSCSDPGPHSLALSVVRPAVKDRRIVLCDDSLVRGAQIQTRVRELRAAGASEVHVRVACPPLMLPCEFGSSNHKAGEFMARQLVPDGLIRDDDHLRKVADDAARLVGADTLRYNTIEDFVDAVGIEEKDLCLGCIHKRPEENTRT